VKRESAPSNQLTIWLGGMALGAAAMYLADPQQGRRRRALAQDKLRSYARQTGDAVDLALRDAGNRWQGIRVQLDRVLQGTQVKPIDDHVLAARVRSKLGRKVSHPHAVTVEADKGRIVLRGPVLADEHAVLLSLVQSIPGVIDVKDKLEVHQEADQVAALQGEGRRAGRSSGPVSSRTLTTAGAIALGYYLIRNPLTGIFLTLAGAGLVALRIGKQEVESSAVVEPEKPVDIKAAPERDSGNETRGPVLH
jgi:hypothetical protein